MDLKSPLVRACRFDSGFGTMNIKGLHEIPHASPYFFRLDKCLSGETPRQTLQSDHFGQSLDPFASPVAARMRGIDPTGCPPSCVTLVFSCIFVGVGAAAAATLHSVEFAARGEVVTFVTASQVSVDFKVDDHKTSPW
ncbi:hypothetical protein KVQ74_04600 [Pseudomonas sp. COW3]|nr:hypothetical protein [Pseudomonas botevensis]